MNVYFLIHNQEEEVSLKNELVHSKLEYKQVQVDTMGKMCIKTPLFTGEDIEYFSQCYSLEKITDS